MFIKYIVEVVMQDGGVCHPSFFASDEDFAYEEGELFAWEISGQPAKEIVVYKAEEFE